MAGSVTRRKAYQRDAPSVRAASSKRPSNWRSEASTVSTRNGMATNVWATITPQIVNGSRNVEPPVEPLAEQAAPPEREEQGGAGDDRRQHHRQRAQGPHEAAAGEADPRQDPRQRDAEDERQRGGGQRACGSTATARCGRPPRRGRPSSVLHGSRHSSPMNGSAKNSDAR